MGFFDGITQAFERVAETATAAIQHIAESVEEIQRKIREQAERAAEQLAQSVMSQVNSAADSMCHELEELLPKFDDKLQQVIDEITELASSAADEGVDITEAVNAAVEIAVQKVEDAKTAAIKAVKDFIDHAQDKLFGLLKAILPGFLHSSIDWLKDKVKFVVNNLVAIGARLIENGISFVLQKIKVFVQDLVRKVGEVLGPIWKFIKQIWKLLFGQKPEQCELVVQWIEEKMKRTERQFLQKAGVAPVSAVIRRHKFFELLPPDEISWKALVHEFLDREDSTAAWRSCQDSMKPLLATTRPKPGSMVQLTWDNPYTDELGGQQRVQITVIYFRWRTEEFRKVSAGFIGIVAMISAVDACAKPFEPPTTRGIPHDPPLQMDSAVMQAIYDELAPHMRLLSKGGSQDSGILARPKRTVSRQLKFRDDDGVWRTVDV